jgi:cupin fold WbuC family metalloprotein
VHGPIKDQKIVVATTITAADLKQLGEGVYYSPYDVPLVNETLIDFLKHVARTTPLRRARFCAHPDPNADQHDMLIVSHRDTYVTPHRHFCKSESLVILEGFGEFIFFSEHGEAQKVVRMGPPSSGLPFFYRMPPRQFHSLSIESDLLVFVESTRGPFNLADREHAPWAPPSDDALNGKAYIGSLIREWYAAAPGR